ncbi:MAG: FG-GAP-like repeat-containing protein [Acidimicrobiales bacterium]
MLNGNCGLKASFDNTDTVWSAPALFDVDGDGDLEIFIGGDATAGALPHSGGYLRSLDMSGGALVQRWVQLSSEAFQNAPAIGDINGDGRPEVVIGSGQSYCLMVSRCADSNKVWAFHADDGSPVPGWPQGMNGPTFLGSPALGDVNGDGGLDVVIGSKGGDVAAFDGGGGLLWRRVPGGGDEVISKPIIADVNGDGANEVVVGTGGSFHILAGTTGIAGQSPVGGGVSYKSAAAVGQLGAGRWAVVTAGFPTQATGRLRAYDIPAPARTPPWPMFRRNAARTAAGPPVPPPPCFSRYWLVAADGGIFAFGEAPFLGSTGAIRLNSPIVGMAATASGSGYWLVAADGGVFVFGQADFLGSTGNIPLNLPIVGMAPAPDGRGYWLVASDGGIFTFGAADFFGSTGAIRLNSPIVGMAATTTGLGYWLVAADGGIFTFGDAPFLGSTGALRLNRPVVGMAAVNNGTGYRMVASDGGIFTFGNAPFCGSTGSRRLNQPIVGMR